MSLKTPTAPTAYELARERYAELGIDTDSALDRLAKVPISLHCWQGDDVEGFETERHALGGGIAVTGNYPGKARTPDELRLDLEKVFSFLPGRHRLNLHASYGEFGEARVDRNEIEVSHFNRWIDWAGEHGLGLDFNPTYYAHPKAEDGFTLAHRDPAIRDFWIEHGKRCRRIAAAMGKALNTPCVTNSWIPDGYKDIPADRSAPRQRLTSSLDEVFREPFNKRHQLDAVECKLFGIGSESYVAGSHEYYMGYALSRNKLLCLDAGHFHPTESIADKISSVMQWIPEILLHVSRGVRWDSDHVVILNDDLQAIAHELVRGNYLERTHIGLDFFDASINRIAAWTIGTRAMIKALLIAMLEPTAKLRHYENEGNFTRRLALMEELKMLPFGSVWDHYCERSGVPAGSSWLDEVDRYEASVLSQRKLAVPAIATS